MAGDGGRSRRCVQQHVAGRGHERRGPVPVVVRLPRAAVLGQRPVELHPQGVAADHQRDAGRHGQAGRAAAHRPGYRVRDHHGHHHEHHDGGQGRIHQQFFPDEELRRGQQAQPDPGLDGVAPAGDDAQQGVDQQRRQHRELEVVVADRGRDQGRGEPVHRPAERRGADPDAPAPQHPVHRRRRSGVAQREQQGQAGLRAGQQGHRGQQHAREQQRRVPHQVDAVRRVHRGGDQGRQAPVRHRLRRIPDEPREQVDVGDVSDLHARGGVGPQPPGHRDRAEQVQGQDQPRRPRPGAQPWGSAVCGGFTAEGTRPTATSKHLRTCGRPIHSPLYGLYVGSVPPRARLAGTWPWSGRPAGQGVAPSSPSRSRTGPSFS